jgi:hypothetical protein
MGVFALSALRVEHTSLTKQLQGAFVAHHGDSDALAQFSEALVVKDPRSESSEEQYAKDRAKLLADMAGNNF